MPSDQTPDPERVVVTLQSSVPQADLFRRDLPAIKEGPRSAWEAGRTLIDFGSAVLSSIGQLRSEHRIRDAVLIALLRRALITIESIYGLLARGLEETATALGRTLLEIDLNTKLVHQDKSDVMAKRLAAFHYYTYQQHGQGMLADPVTRKGTLDPAERVPETIEVSKSYARLLESEVFDDVRDDVRRSQYWHGLRNTEAAFRTAEMASDYFMTYDIATWFVHDVNVDADYSPSEGEEGFRLKALAERDPKIVQLHLAQVLFRFHSILSTYVEERGLPHSPAFKEEAKITFPDGHTEALDLMDGMMMLLLSEFPSRSA
jgi:hypothetical protein